MPVAVLIPFWVAVVCLVAAALLAQMIGWAIWEWSRDSDER
jgi:hypothetical protein